MTQTTTRRSFFVDLLNRAAGAWIVLAGGSALSGCFVGGNGGLAPDSQPTSDTGQPLAPEVTGKYGGPPVDLEPEPAPPAQTKYGGPPDRPEVMPMYGGPGTEEP